MQEQPIAQCFLNMMQQQQSLQQQQYLQQQQQMQQQLQQQQISQIYPQQPENDQQINQKIENEQSNQQVCEKKTRRTRKDQNDRKYICGCGKSYLSYPALYTHLKQKHNGQPPESTVLPNVSGKQNNRGRPPKKEESEQQKQEEEKSADQNDTIDVLDDILVFLDTIDKSYRRTKSDGWNMDQKLSDIFPLYFFEGKDEFEYKVILDGIKQLEDYSLNYLVEQLDSRGEIKKTEMNKIFVLFLNYIAKGVANDALKEIMIFLCFYRKALNQYGWDALEQKLNSQNNTNNNQMDDQVYDNDVNGSQTVNKDSTYHSNIITIDQEKKSQEYCQVNNGDDAFLICNEFIIEILPNYLKEYNCDGLNIIGKSDEQLKNVVYIIQHFANWLFNNRYTNTKLSIFPDKNDDE